MPRPTRWLAAGLIAGSLMSTRSVDAVAQQLDYAATYIRGLQGYDSQIQGHLIVADSAIFFTKRNGNPVFVLSYGDVANTYASPDLWGKGEESKWHYLVVSLNRADGDQAVVFQADPFVPDTLVSAILARLDTRRTRLYSSGLPPTPQRALPAGDAVRPSAELPQAPRAAREVPPEHALTGQSGHAVAKADRVPEIEEGSPGYKDGGTATLLSLLITGGGQFYAGDTGGGAALLLGSIAAIGIGAGLSSTECGFYSCSDHRDGLYAGIAVAGVLSLMSLFDAAPATHRHNRKLAARMASHASLTPVFVPSNNRTKIGLNLAVGW
jgi:hypothetical protein